MNNIMNKCENENTILKGEIPQISHLLIVMVETRYSREDKKKQNKQQRNHHIKYTTTATTKTRAIEKYENKGKLYNNHEARG